MQRCGQVIIIVGSEDNSLEGCTAPDGIPPIPPPIVAS